MIKGFSIRKKLIVAFILIGVFPMLIATYVGIKIASVRLEKGIEERINYAGKSAVYLLAQKKTELAGVAKSFADDPRLRQAIQGGVNIKFLWFDTPLKVLLYNARGKMIFSSADIHLPRPLHPEKGMTLIRNKTGKAGWPLLVYLLPVSDKGKPIGTIMTGYTLNQEFLNNLKSMTGVESILLKKDAAGSYRSLGSKDRLDLDETTLQRVVKEKRQAFIRNAALHRGGNRHDYYALLTPLPDADGKVSLLLFNGIPASETLGGKLSSARFYYILILLGLALSVITGSAVATGISWPILRFSQGVRAISAGDYNQKIHIHSKDEIGILADSFNRMTDRLRETIAQLVENRNYTENILKSLLNGVITIDPLNRIVRVNRAAEQILNLPQESIVGRTFSEVFHQDPKLQKLIRDSLDHRRMKEGIETELHREDGKTIPIELSLSLLEESSDSSSGKGGGLVLLVRDLTEIQVLKEHIRRQDRLAALGELSAGIAHEIRNPLGIIKGAAGLLRKESFSQSAKTEELTSVILEEVDRLNEVISDFLEFARPKPPLFKPQNINELIRNTLQMVALQIDEQKTRIKERLEPGLPPILADEHQMHQIFLNLLLNALQATDRGDTITIESRFLPEEGQIQVRFSDTGIGIPEHDRKKVFNPFFTTREGGTGLGLSVVSQIVENHHGKIFLTGEEGKGSCFTLRFPVQNIPAVENHPAS
ncbi:MAG: PAS domain-containing protein [Deltaproteobacteria bacterium]|nr:PAS domain-containing protein [Deltaproteobacteria bacterium]